MSVLKTLAILLLALAVPPSFCHAQAPVNIKLKDNNGKVEVERIIANSSKLSASRRIEYISRYLIGRKYRPETKARIKKQRSKKVEKTEATNTEPMPVKFLRTSMEFLDCMTYVEHVLALSTCKNSSYERFLCRLVDVMFNAKGKPLMSHHRSHFTSIWGDINEQKGYLYNFARKHPEAKVRKLLLNKVGKNRTYYVKDTFLISQSVQNVWYFPIKAILKRKVKLQSGDIIAMATNKEGLDVTHMAFFIKRNNNRLLRHASYTHNKIMDENFDEYLKKHKKVMGLMVFRPTLKAKEPAKYTFSVVGAKPN